MAVRPSLEWRKRYQSTWSTRNAEHGDKDMPPSARQIASGELSSNKGQINFPVHQNFIQECNKHGVKPTIRQARKFKQKRGKFAKSLD